MKITLSDIIALGLIIVVTIIFSIYALPLVINCIFVFSIVGLFILLIWIFENSKNIEIWSDDK